MHMSIHFAVSLMTLLLGAVSYLIGLVTTAWVRTEGVLTFGVWEYCVLDEVKSDWKCISNTADFSMAAQAFSILAILCYACAFFLYFLYLIFPSLYKSKPITMGLCLLAFSVVSLQIMTMVVFGVKVRQFLTEVELKHFSRYLGPLRISWSFAAAIVSTILATVGGVCTFIELRNITIDEFE